MKNGKNLIKKITVLLVVLLFCMIPANVNAKESAKDLVGKRTVKNNGIYMVTGDGCRNEPEFGYDIAPISDSLSAGWNIKSMKVTLSDKKTLSVAPLGEPLSSVIWMTYKKPGRTRVTVTAVMKKGKKSTKTVTCKFTIVTQKFASPLASMKIGGKEYAKKITKCQSGVVHAGGKKKLKFTYKLKPGWKISSEGNCFWALYLDKSTKIKNGSTIDMTSKYAQEFGINIWGFVTNTKTGRTEEIGLRVLPR